MFKSQICKTILSARDMTVFMPSCHLLTLYVYLGQEGMELDGTHVNKHMNKPWVMVSRMTWDGERAKKETEQVIGKENRTGSMTVAGREKAAFARGSVKGSFRGWHLSWGPSDQRTQPCSGFRGGFQESPRPAGTLRRGPLGLLWPRTLVTKNKGPVWVCFLRPRILGLLF